MTVLENYKSTTTGNDCVIYKDISLVELNGIYSVISSTKYSGWMGVKIDNQIYDKEDAKSAKKMYNALIMK